MGSIRGELTALGQRFEREPGEDDGDDAHPFAAPPRPVPAAARPKVDSCRCPRCGHEVEVMRGERFVTHTTAGETLSDAGAAGHFLARVCGASWTVVQR
jgi:hypothetical protein